MANYNVDILFNADIRKALKGVDKLQGGVRSVVKEIEKFEQSFKRIAQGPSNRVALAQQRQLAGAIGEQNRAIAEQITLASQLGSIYDANARKASEFFRVVRAVADVRQKALPGAGFPGQRALPAAGGTKGEFQRSAQAAAIIDEQNALAAALRRETAAREAAAKASEDLTRETVRIRGLLPPGRSGQSFTRGVDVSGPAVGVGARTGGGSGFQSKVQREVDRQLRVNGQLTKELQETVDSYNKLQTQNNKLVKTTGRLSKEINKESREYASSKPNKRGSGGPGGIGASIGFPLLFGGGAGSIAGGVIGSLTGGFDNAILGSGVGAQVDQFAGKLVGLAGTLDGTGGSTEALEALLGDLDSETARRIQNLEKSGQTALAAEAAFQKLSDEIGDDLAKAAVLAGQDLKTLSNQVTKFFTILGVSIASLIQEALYLNTRDPLEGVSEVSPETAVERATSGETVEVARVELELAEAKLAKDQEAASVAEQKLIDLRKTNDLGEITRQIQDDILDAKVGENKQREIELRARKETADLAERTAAADERSTREAERAAAKAKREADAAFRKRQQELKKLRQGQAELKGAQVQSLEVDLQFVKTFYDRETAIKSERANIQGILDLKIDQLRLTTEDNKLLLVKEYILARQADMKDRALEKELFALRVSERRLKIEKQIERQSKLTSIDRQIETVNIGKGPGSEEQLLALDQQIRREDALIEARQKLAVINDKIRSLDPTSAGQEYTKLVRERTEQESYNTSLQGRLDLLDQAEQAQLKFNQAFEAAKPIADAVTTGLFTAISAVVEGTKTAEEAFADFLKNIGDMLIQAAAQMIAQYIAISIARAFAFGGSGGFASNPTGTSTNFIGSGLSGFRAIGLAEGGYVTGPTRAVVGEGGEPEYVIPQSKMRESMSRYSRGVRGDAVIPSAGSSGSSGEGGVATAGAPIDVRYTVERINNVDYVTAEQFQQGMQQAAQRGATEGERRTMRSLQNSTAVRRSLAF